MGGDGGGGNHSGWGSGENMVKSQCGQQKSPSSLLTVEEAGISSPSSLQFLVHLVYLGGDGGGGRLLGRGLGDNLMSMWSADVAIKFTVCGGETRCFGFSLDRNSRRQW